MKSLKEVLMERDGMSETEAEELIQEAREDMMERLADGEMPHDICEEWFGLEPDYIMDLIQTNNKNSQHFNQKGEINYGRGQN